MSGQSLLLSPAKNSWLPETDGKFQGVSRPEPKPVAFRQNHEPIPCFGTQFFTRSEDTSRTPEAGLPLPRLRCAHTYRQAQGLALPTQVFLLEVLRRGALRRLQVCPEFVHVVERLGEEGPAAVDLHQGQVIQLKRKRKPAGLVEET